MSLGRRRALSAAELRLWVEVARSVEPLPGRLAPALPPEPAAPGEAAAPPGAPERVPSGAARVTPPPLLTAPDRRLARALARGKRVPDAVLDLHGLDQAAAHRRLATFLRAAQGAGHGVVLVITGHGGRSGADAPYAVPFAAGGERGVLRRLVPHWLALPDLRPVVLGFTEAGPRQGGAGALHVRLRRARA